MNTLLEKFITVFGEYEPITVILQDGSETVVTNWGYVSMIVIFCILFWCCLRIMGAIISHD